MKLRTHTLRSLVSLVTGALLATTIFVFFVEDSSAPSHTFGQQPNEQKVPSETSLAKDVATLNDKSSDQSHAMTDVDYHFSNLWFAAHAKNWPLAEFYWKETLSHIKWAVRIIPVRKDKEGREIKLEEIFQSIENSPTAQVGKTIEAKDLPEFEKAYRFMLEGCYSCHKAADKPYLRPRIPERPASNMINFDPNADWPK